MRPTSLAPAVVGARLLGEVEEASLDEVLAALRAHLITTTTTTTTTTTSPLNLTTSTTTTISNSIPSLLPLHPDAPRLPIFPFASLNRLAALHLRSTHSPTVGITGSCHHALLYPLIATLVAPPHGKAVTIIDCEGGFDPLRLLATRPYEDVVVAADAGTATAATTIPTIRPRPGSRPLRLSDLEHVHVIRPPNPFTSSTTTTTTTTANGTGTAASIPSIPTLLASLETYMLYSRKHKSHAREWWGTVLLSPPSSSSSSSSVPSFTWSSGGGENTTTNTRTRNQHPPALVAVTAGQRKGWLRVERRRVGEVGVGGNTERLEGEGEGEQARGWLVASSPWGEFRILEEEAEEEEEADR